MTWFNRWADARKRLDDLLIELEHKLFIPAPETTRVKIFTGSFLEIRKATTEYGRWMICPGKKSQLRQALWLFQGLRHEPLRGQILDMQGTDNTRYIDTMLTNEEVGCISDAPNRHSHQHRGQVCVRMLYPKRAGSFSDLDGLLKPIPRVLIRVDQFPENNRRAFTFDSRKDVICRHKDKKKIGPIFVLFPHNKTSPLVIPLLRPLDFEGRFHHRDVHCGA